jgi:glycosyltransferase involved in cell wall biosynthesis
MNCAAELVLTANSIRAQNKGLVQWIIVDGGSSDAFLDVVRENNDIIDHWISEADGGIYDAWNKACEFIQGEWVIFLGAGDVFFSADTLEKVVASLINIPPAVLFAYGNVVQMSAGIERYRWGRVDLDDWDIYRPKLPAHQGIFHRANLLARTRPFDSSYRVVADSKLLLSVMREQNTLYLDIDVCAMEPGGVSSSPASTLKVMREFLRLEEDIGYRIPWTRRTLFIFRSYTKFIIYKIAGQAAVDIATSLKRSLS